jgi:nitrate/nitrite-specific signal transduction histidine kinase
VTAEAPSRYCISVEDNGKGFDATASYQGHYGLENMKERAGEIHVKLEITSGENKGTMVTLSKDP